LHVGIDAVVTLAVLASAGLILRDRTGRLYGLLVLVPLLLVSTVAWLTGDRILDTRNLIGIAPFAAIALAWGCASLPSRKASFAAGALIAALVVGGFVYGQTQYGRTPYDEIARALRAQGLRGRELVVWFGNQGGIPPVGWYIDPKASAAARPGLEYVESRRDECAAFEVVARTGRGRRWLESHRGAVRQEVRLRSYGDVLQGARREDLVVARLQSTPGILDSLGPTRNRYLLRLKNDTRPC
jgi:hypothetical protein